MTTPRSVDPFAGPPRLHGAARVGIRPGTELIHPLAATGARPLRFEVEGLPDGLQVDDEGVLRGVAPGERGVVPLAVRVTNVHGEASARVELVVGDTLALTPPMGWNSWNVFASEVTAEVVIRMADRMVETGMRDLGYAYVNIDDHWHAPCRETGGRPAANAETFPDGMAAVAEHVHARGLKLGIYSDAADRTCGGCFGSLGHEETDARTYAEWGVDLLKYDYCHAPANRAAAVARYTAMSRAVATSGRSIVFSVCEWGFRRPWQWAAQVGGSYWRTTPDIFDTFSWSILGVRGIARRNLRLGAYAGPGHWNDPDMLLVGNHGRGLATGVLRDPRTRRKLWTFSGISDAEALSHVTLWAMMAAPLLASHDLADSSDLDRALLMNPDVLAVNQDPLGVQARKVASAPGLWVLAKPLVDGSTAVSITNVGPMARRVRFPLDSLGLAGPVECTDLWEGGAPRQISEIEAHLARHDSVAYRCTPVPSGRLP